MGYSDGYFIRRDPARRTQRDLVRSRFFSDLGVEPTQDPFRLELGAQPQSNLVGSLLAEVIGREGSENEVLEMISAKLLEIGLGNSDDFERAGSVVFSALAPTAYAKHFFVNHWGNQSDEVEEMV